ncbi:MAG: CoA transferase [Candidatus Caldarchaeum sp.]|nr:CoA transferase [Candidatus Caldarchaeum sp.]
MASFPLSGVKVIEFGSAVAAPLCGMLLAEMGAEVVKVENTREGDDARKMGKMVNGESLYFAHYNKNKQSIAVDLKTPEGRQIVRKLVKSVDILVENYRPGVLRKHGLGFEDVRRINRKIIYCSISGFGSRGRYKNYRGYDVITQAMSGLMWMNRRPGDEPLRIPVPVTDILAGLSAAAAVCAALHQRQKNGKAVKIDLSLLQSGIAAMGQWITTVSKTGEQIQPFGNRYPALAPYEPVKAADGWLVVAVGNEEHWERLCSVIGRDDMKNNPRFKDMQSRIDPFNREIIHNELEKTVSTKTVKEWVELLQRAGVPAGPVYSVEDVLRDKNLAATKIFTRVNHPILGWTLAIRTSPLFDGRPSLVKPAPIHGQDTRRILRKLGYSPEAIKDFERRQIVKSGR